MTCIVGIEKGGTVWLGGDSAGTSGNLDQTVIKDPKVFVKDECIFGVCGLPLVMDALRYQVELPRQQRGDDDRRFVAADLIPAIKAGLAAAGCVKDHPEHGQYFEGAILFGTRGKLYRLESNFQVITDAYGFDAVGSGANIATGSLHATKSVGSVHKRIIMALEASAIGNAGVRPPFNIVSCKKRFWQ